jgi:hypothetical protein
VCPPEPILEDFDVDGAGKTLFVQLNHKINVVFFAT